MSANNMKKEKGAGTFTLGLGLLPTALTAQYNGVSLIKLAMDAAHLTYAPWMAASGLILSVPGLFLGLSNKEDGARLGTFLCGLNAIGTFIQLGMDYLGAKQRGKGHGLGSVGRQEKELQCGTDGDNAAP